jgi:hypothetical protein
VFVVLLTHPSFVFLLTQGFFRGFTDKVTANVVSLTASMIRGFVDADRGFR